MVCLGFEPEAAEWGMSYGTPTKNIARTFLDHTFFFF